MSPGPKVVFWGAGATASLGFKTTVWQSRALRELVLDRDSKEPLEQRVRFAATDPWRPAFQDLLTVLGDGLQEEDSNFAIKPCQLAAMRRNWQSGANDDELRQRIIYLRTLYDWPALQAAIRLCPGTAEESDASDFQISDLFNLLDMHGQSGHGFRKGHGDRDHEFLTPQQVVGARNALKMLLQAMFYVDWQHARQERRIHLSHHYDFAKAIGRRMQRQGMDLARRFHFDSRSFYIGDVSFVSLNYDPVAIWCQYVANRDLNGSPSVPHVDSPALRLKVFHDLGHFVASSRVEIKLGRDRKTPWYPMNESSAQRLNDDDHGSNDRIRITKFLLPHGCLWWRECPNCGKLSAYMGHSWDTDSAALIPPPPLRAFVQPGTFKCRFDSERDAWKEGKVDARACVHCQTLTYAHHTQTRMQSNFKDQPPPFLEEISRDLRVAVQEAHHIILMGYTLPPDDVDYRAFFAARRRPGGTVKCSVVVGTKEEPRWLGPSEWSDRLSAMKVGEPPRTTLEAARDLFEKDNVRFFGGGIPQVFLDGGSVTEAAVEKLLNWDAG